MKTHALLSPLSVAVAFALFHTPLIASEQEKGDIESITVVGSPTNTEIVPADLDKYQANDLADIFQLIPSVSVGGSVGIAQKVYIRGLEDTLLNVTVDGAPQTGTLFHHIGRVSIDPELLQEVEVQAGAGEATSGAGVIGGAIRFKTKNVDDLLDPEAQFGGTLKASHFSNDGHKFSGTAYGRLSDDWGMLAAYTKVDRDNLEDGDGQILFGTAAEQSLAFFKVSGAINAQQTLTLSHEVREEEGDFGPRPNWPTLATDPLFHMKGERQTSVVNYAFAWSSLLNLEATAYLTRSDIKQNRDDRWGLYGAEMKTWGFDIRNVSQSGDHTLTYGIEYRKDDVSSGYLAPAEVWQKWAWDANVGHFAEEGTVKSIYLQEHWQVSSALLLSGGLRYDEYAVDQLTYGESTDSDGVSSNIGLTYALNDAWTFNAGYAEAIRGKEVGDAFTLSKRPGRISFAPDLDAEEVRNTELGLAYQGSHLQVKAAVYQSDIDSVIHDQIGSGPAPQNSTYYENIGELETDGFELSARYWLDALTLSASYSHNDAKINGQTVEGYEHIGLANARGDTWNVGLDYTWSERVELGWNITVVESLDDIEVLHRGVDIGWIDGVKHIDKPSYQVHDIYLKWFPLSSEQLEVNAVVKNLFNEHYRDHSSVGDYSHIKGWEAVQGLYEAGRDIRLNISYRF